MAQDILDHLTTIIWKVMELMNGQMGENMRESGIKIKCTGKGPFRFQMEDIIKVFTEMTRRMEEGFTSGLMGEGMKENFTKVNNMELELLFLKMEKKELLSLKMGSEYDG